MMCPVGTNGRRFDVSLGVYGQEVPAALADRTTHWLAGDLYNGTMQRQEPGWYVDADPAAGESVEDHVAWLLEVVRPSADLIRNRPEGGRARLLISVYRRRRQPAPAVYLSPRQVAELADMRVAVDVDVY